jgi:acyl dehydratase
MQLKDLAGYDLGSRTIGYEARDAILYALAVGAPAEAIDLVYERDLRTLPAYACALGLWAVEAAGELGAYDRNYSLHASQALVMHRPMPASGSIETTARVSGVWDKGKAAMVDIEVASEVFTASYGIFLPGLGGWGGERGPTAIAAEPATGPEWQDSFATWPNQAAIYRLTGDLHPIHIDPAVAKANGFGRPILHGLCTLGIAARLAAAGADAHPADLTRLLARLAAPVLPGDDITVCARGAASGLNFEARVGDTVVLKGGWAEFGQQVSSP